MSLSISQALAQSQRNTDPSADSSRLDAELLLAHTLQKSRTFLYTWPEQSLSADQLRQFRELLQRRAGGEPVAYIIGYRAFWSFELEVNRHVLIPRPETELLVELGLATGLELCGNVDAALSVADLGTGSGAVALALASERPRWRICATDLSLEALKVAKRNCRRLHLPNVTFQQGFWCDALPPRPFDLIVSNPPYVAADDEHLSRGDLRFEPVSALAAGADGLADIRLICVQARQKLRPGGWLLIEHGYQQRRAVEEILSLYGYDDITSATDTAGHDRVSGGRFQG